MDAQPRQPPYLVLLVLLSSSVEGVKSHCNLQPEQFLTGQHVELFYTVSNNIGVHKCPIMLQKQEINETKTDADYVGDCHVTNNGSYVCTPTERYRITGGLNKIVISFEKISAVNEGRYQFHFINCNLTRTDECHVKLKSNLKGGFDSDVSPVPETVRTTSNGTNDETKNDASNGTPTGLIVGLPIAIASGVLVLIGFVVWWRLGRNWKCEKRSRDRALEVGDLPNRHVRDIDSNMRGNQAIGEEENNSNPNIDTTPLRRVKVTAQVIEANLESSSSNKPEGSKKTRLETPKPSSKQNNCQDQFGLQSQRGGNFPTQRHETPRDGNTLNFDLEKQRCANADNAAPEYLVEETSLVSTQADTFHCPSELSHITLETNTQVGDTNSTQSSVAESKELQNRQNDVESEPEEDIDVPKEPLLQHNE